ncbi:DUF2971 domain-containing protein [Rheinheimera faecalis]
MLDKLYKYTALRLNFFDDLMIRASQKYVLNDPFELMPGGKKNKINISDLYYDYAVISLSETNNNLLMWSHYAEQHQGIVIEFDTTKPLFNSYRSYVKTMYDPEIDDEVIDAEETERRLIINAGAIQRVRYNTKRPDAGGFDNLLEHFLVKSDEWIYEKEHRVIVPLAAADKVIINKKYLDTIEFSMCSPDVLETKHLDKDMCIINFKGPLVNEYRARYSYNSNFLPDDIMEGAFAENIIYSYLKELSKDPSTVFLYKVPPESIKAVFIGCRINGSKRTEILKKINSNPELSHVSVFQAEVCSERFELKFKRLNKFSRRLLL